MDKSHFIKEVQIKLDQIEKQLALSPDQKEELRIAQNALKKQLAFLKTLPEYPSGPQTPLSSNRISTQKTFPLTALANIPTLLNKLGTEGSDNNFLILHLHKERNFFIQFLSQKESDTILCLAVSNIFLAEKHQLNADQLTCMEALGWRLNGDEFSEHFQIKYNVKQTENYQELIELVTTTARAVYGVIFSPSIEVTLNIE
ncbi:MAG: hypothetical protein AAF985_09310 [Bacteroidota bacterium]